MSEKMGMEMDMGNAEREASLLKERVLDPENPANDYESAHQQLEKEKTPQARLQKIADKIGEIEARATINGEKQGDGALLAIKEYIEGPLDPETLSDAEIGELEFMVETGESRPSIVGIKNTMDKPGGMEKETAIEHALMSILDNFDNIDGSARQVLEAANPNEEGKFDISTLSRVQKDLIITAIQKAGYETQDDLKFVNKSTVNSIKRLGFDKLLPEKPKE